MRILDGWKQIAEFVAKCAKESGLDISVSVGQVRIWSSRGDDPLPVRRVGRLVRKHVIAMPLLVQAWAKREFEALSATG